MMKTKLTATCFLLSITLLTNAQLTKDKFLDIVDQESPANMYGVRENHSSQYLHKSENNLPQWFFNPPQMDSKIYAIGISDPAMDSANAINLAIYRGIVLANVLNRSVTKLLCEFYSDDVANTISVSYENFSRISSEFSLNKTDYTIVNSYTTSYDEVIVLLEFDSPIAVNDSLKKKVLIETYRNETETSIYGTYESVYELLVKENYPLRDTHSLYQTTELANSFDVVSKYDTLNYNIPIFSLSYSNFSTVDSVSTIFMPNGLWKEYLKAFANEIVNKAKQKPENISNLSEKNNTNSYQKLTKGISKNIMSFRLDNISSSNSNVIIYLTEVQVDK